MKKPTHELVIATWPEAHGYRYFGCVDYGAHFDDSSTCYVPLRAVIEGDKFPWFDDSVRCINDICLYCYFSIDGCVSIELRTNESGTQTLRQLEYHVKMMKKLTAKASKTFNLGDFKRGSDFHTELTKIVAALGIKRSVQYHGIGTQDTYVPVGVAVRKIAEVIEQKLSEMAKRKAAA